MQKIITFIMKLMGGNDDVGVDVTNVADVVDPNPILQGQAGGGGGGGGPGGGGGKF